MSWSTCIHRLAPNDWPPSPSALPPWPTAQRPLASPDSLVVSDRSCVERLTLQRAGPPCDRWAPPPTTRAPARQHRSDPVALVARRGRPGKLAAIVHTGGLNAY